MILMYEKTSTKSEIGEMKKAKLAKVVGNTITITNVNS